ncbi:MAG: adenylate/guanylate cyclase domain-containing protein, partial [Acidobacteriota bacterium]
MMPSFASALQLLYTIDGAVHRTPLDGEAIRVGRSSDNQIVLPHFSVSRHHALLRADDDARWTIEDLGSTNGVQINGVGAVGAVALAPGDRVQIGSFLLTVEALEVDPVAAASERQQIDVLLPDVSSPPRDHRPAAADRQMALSQATIVRPLADFTAAYGLEPEAFAASPPAATSQPADAPRAVAPTPPHPISATGVIRQAKREALDRAYASQLFSVLTRLARDLMDAAEIDEVLTRTMEATFDALPVERGMILRRRSDDAPLACELLRVRDETTLWPTDNVPVSRTIVDAVMKEKVALLTYDAAADQRLATNASVRIHQIRGAICAPLWSGTDIIGVLQVDSRQHPGSFQEQDVDLLTAFANQCAVAIERIENARRASFERQVRAQLERYHSPAVIEAVLQGEAEASSSSRPGARRGLAPAEVTVLYADLVGFTSFTESASPEALAALLEGFFNHAVDAIFEAGGTLDKFIGDCVMAFFGAPVAQPDHAVRAVRAAVDLRRALRAWNAARDAGGLPVLESRIAINTGPVVVGDVGSARRVDYTILGNTVNVASRLESAVAGPGDIVIGEATRAAIG